MNSAKQKDTKATQKLVAFLYTMMNNLKNYKNGFTYNGIKKNEILRNYLTKQVKDL